MCIFHLSFPEDVREDWPHFHDKTINIVDAWWMRLATDASYYRGWDTATSILPPNSSYMFVSTDANSGVMQVAISTTTNYFYLIIAKINEIYQFEARQIINKSHY